MNEIRVKQKKAIKSSGKVKDKGLGRKGGEVGKEY